MLLSIGFIHVPYELKSMFSKVWCTKIVLTFRMVVQTGANLAVWLGNWYYYIKVIFKHWKPTLAIYLRCRSNLNSTAYVLKKSIVLLWLMWLSLYFYKILVTRCYYYHTILLYFFAVTKNWSINQWIQKDTCQNKTLSNDLNESLFNELWTSFQLNWIPENLFRV